MIEGLKVTVAGTELRDLCLKQAEFHDARRATYAENVKNLADAEQGDEEAGIGAITYTGHADPKKALRDKAAQHGNSADELRFIAGHLELSETYLLDDAALRKLGVTKNGYGF